MRRDSWGVLREDSGLLEAQLELTLGGPLLGLMVAAPVGTWTPCGVGFGAGGTLDLRAVGGRSLGEGGSFGEVVLA